MRLRAARLLASLGGVAIVTLVAQRLSVNATTIGFAYLLLVLIVASLWGFSEAVVASLLATLLFNFLYLPPVGTFTITDPHNWVALFSFLATSLIASRLSDRAKRRTLEAIERQQDLERLYTFSRAILLINSDGPFPKELTEKVAATFGLSAVVLYERRTGIFYRAGPLDFEGLDDQLKESALHGTSFADPFRNRVITAVRLGAEPIASLALQGVQMPDAVLQGVANLVAIGLERARAQGLAHQIEAARQSEQLRTTLIDAMAHEFKTPLTSIKAATTSLLANSGETLENRLELIAIADEEADHLRDLIDNAVEMARLDTARIEVHLELSNLRQLVDDVVASLKPEIENRPIQVTCDSDLAPVAVDQRLLKLALKQLVDNAMKYSPPGKSVGIWVHNGNGAVTLDVTDHGTGIPGREQQRVFERFYRSPSVQHQVPGSGLGLSIAHRIARAHNGDLTVTSQPGETTFRITLPSGREREQR